MKGIIGLLLVVVGLEVAYLVLAGKLPLQIKPKASGTGGGPDSSVGGLDLRQFVHYGTHGKGPAVGMPLPSWEGLAN